MEWLKPLLPVIQTALRVYTSGQFLKKSSANAKDVALRSTVIALGTLSFLVFFITAIIMMFVDLGHQFEAQDVHFSGMMLSAILLIAFGLLLFGICFAIAKYLSVLELRKKALVAAEPQPTNTLALFGEEFIKQLIENLSKKDSQ